MPETSKRYRSPCCRASALGPDQPYGEGMGLKRWWRALALAVKWQQSLGDTRGVPTFEPASGERQAFGYKNGWIACRTEDLDAVAAALGLFDRRQVGWSSGVDASYECGIYVCPPVDGWTLAVGQPLLDPVVDLSQLSGDLRTEVQRFVTHRVVEATDGSRHPPNVGLTDVERRPVSVRSVAVAVGVVAVLGLVAGALLVAIFDAECWGRPEVFTVDCKGGVGPMGSSGWPSAIVQGASPGLWIAGLYCGLPMLLIAGFTVVRRRVRERRTLEHEEL
jgi:hypothetical protein